MTRKEYYKLLKTKMKGNTFWKKTVASQFKKGHPKYFVGLGKKDLICPVCNKQYTVRKNRMAKYCSSKCYWTALIGREVPVEQRRKMAASRKGNKSHLWKGGKTSEARLLRTVLEYRLWRESVYKRDDYTCQFCGQRGGRLNADHIKRFAEYPELRFAIDNGRTLCEPCHKKTETYGNYKHGKYKKYHA